MSNIFIRRTLENGRTVVSNLGALQINGLGCADLDREYLWKALKRIGVHGIRPDLGRQEMLERYSEHLDRQPQKPVTVRDADRDRKQIEFDYLQIRLGLR
jgi:hypothetical protein